jgi:uncharacterized phage protein gp47/JayE
MALDETFDPIYLETTQTVRARLLASLPDHLASIEGSFARDVLEVATFEFTRIWDELNRYLSYTFPTYAFGQLLDGHASNYGLTRSDGTKAEGTVRFTGTVAASTTLNGNHTLPTGTITVVSTSGFTATGSISIGAQTVAYTGVTATTFTGCTGGTGTFTSGTVVTQGTTTVIPVGTIVAASTVDPDAEVPRFTTLNTVATPVGASGYVDIDVRATDSGLNGNVATGGITLLETVDPQLTGIQAVSNIRPTTGGSDPETDDELRERILAEAALPVGSGTVQDYKVWGTEVTGVSHVAVEPLWDTSGETPGSTDGREAGSVRLSIRGPNNVPVDWTTLQAAQKYIDPSRQTVAVMESGEPWTSSGTAPSWNTTQKQTGSASMTITTAGASTSNLATLNREMDLSRFDADDDIFIWVYSPDWTRIANTSYIQFTTTSGTYFRNSFANISPRSTAPIGGGTMPTTGARWWLFRMTKTQLQTGGTATSADWGAVTDVRVQATSNGTGAGNTSWDYWTIRSTAGASGQGRAPIGAAVTVVTPVSKTINVVATGLVLDSGYTIAGAAGTTNVTTLIQNNLIAYFTALEPGDPVRLKDVENVIHDTPGVLDFTAVTLNGSSANVAVTLNEYAVLGTLTLS